MFYPQTEIDFGINTEPQYIYADDGIANSSQDIGLSNNYQQCQQSLPESYPTQKNVPVNDYVAPPLPDSNITNGFYATPYPIMTGPPANHQFQSNARYAQCGNALPLSQNTTSTNCYQYKSPPHILTTTGQVSIPIRSAHHDTSLNSLALPTQNHDSNWLKESSPSNVLPHETESLSPFYQNMASGESSTFQSNLSGYSTMYFSYSQNTGDKSLTSNFQNTDNYRPVQQTFDSHAWGMASPTNKFYNEMSTDPTFESYVKIPQSDIS